MNTIGGIFKDYAPRITKTAAALADTAVLPVRLGIFIAKKLRATRREEAKFLAAGFTIALPFFASITGGIVSDFLSPVLGSVFPQAGKLAGFFAAYIVMGRMAESMLGFKPFPLYNKKALKLQRPVP
jgi:hypothetical protein